MRRFPVFISVAVTAAAVMIAPGPDALAYFAGAGSGSASASITALAAPTFTAATPGTGEAVALAWGVVSPPGPGAVAYYVTRDGGAPSGNCPAVGAPSAVTTCTDSGVSVGEHVYRVAAVWRDWTATSAGRPVTVAAGEATMFTITASSAMPTAGVPVDLTITAKEAGGATATGYTGTHNLVFAGAESSPGGDTPTVTDASGSAIAFGTATAIKFTAGVAEAASGAGGKVVLYKAGATNVTATEGSITTPTALALTVSAGAAARVALSGLDVSAGSIGSPCLFTCTVTGLGNSGTVKAKAAITDASGNVVSAIGSTKTVKVTTSGGKVSGTRLSIPATGSAVSSKEFTYKAPSSGNFTDTITLASPGYTSATVTARR